MSVRTHSPTPILKYGRGTLLRFIEKEECSELIKTWIVKRWKVLIVQVI